MKSKNLLIFPLCLTLTFSACLPAVAAESDAQTSPAQSVAQNTSANSSKTTTGDSNERQTTSDSNSKQTTSDSNTDNSNSKQNVSDSNTDNSNSKQNASDSDTDNSGSKQNASDSDTDNSGSKQNASDSDTDNSGSKQTSSDQKAKTSAPVATTVTGIPKRINKRIKQSVSFTVKVSPATTARTVRLQRYNSSTKKWKTIKAYQTKVAKTASVKLTIAKKYRKKTTGTWRVLVSATKDAKAFTGKAFKVTTRNIKSVKLNGKSACIYCVDTGENIFTKNSTTRRAHASTTKIMSAILLCESGKIGGKTKISKKAANTPWGGRYIKKGDRYKNLDLLYAMMLPSLNDAATAVSETVSGSTSKFVKAMNTKAATLGLSDTHFKNPHGLDKKGHYSTAVDLTRLTAYAYRFPLIRKAWLTPYRTIKCINRKKKWTLESTDLILGYDKKFKGGKTGTTEKAGYCFSGVYVYKGKTYVTAVLGCDYENGRWVDTKKLHKYIRSYAAKSY